MESYELLPKNLNFVTTTENVVFVGDNKANEQNINDHHLEDLLEQKERVMLD